MDSTTVKSQENGRLLVGRLVCAGNECGRIASVSTPEITQDMAVLSANEMGEANRLKVFDTSIPILAEDRIDYPYQPVLAVFGPDIESVIMFVSETKITTFQPERDSESEACRKKKEFGLTELFFSGTRIDDKTKNVKTKLRIDNYASSLISDTKIIAWQENGIMNIQAATQWPVMLKNAVASSLNTTVDKVFLHNTMISSSRDQLVYKPAMLSVIAAKASVMTSSRTTLSSPLSSVQMKMDFLLESALDTETGQIKAFRGTAKADAGCFAVLAEEIANQITAGLTPCFKTEAQLVDVSVVKSHNQPADFFVDMGFSLASSAAGMHILDIAKFLGVPPDKWIEKNIGPVCTDFSGKIFTGTENYSFSDSVKDVSKKSDFPRKFSAYNQKSLGKNVLDPFVEYSGGIGLSTSYGIRGFSSQYLGNYSHSLAVCKSGDNVLICTSVLPAQNEVESWKDIAGRILLTDNSNISFANINDSRVPDLGPDLMSRNNSDIPSMIKKACIKLASSDSDIATVSLSEKTNDSLDSESLFTINSAGAMVTELHIDTVLLVPVIDHIHVSLCFGAVSDEGSLRRDIKRIISSTVSEICPEVNNTYDVDLSIYCSNNGVPGSSINAVRAMTITSFVNAVSQALRHKINIIPLSISDIRTILCDRGDKNESDS